MLITRRLAAFLLLTGVFQWLVWPGFLRVVWRDERAFDAGGATAFLLVHLAIVLPALLLGTALVVLGARAWQRAPAPGPARAVRRGGRSARA